MDITNMDAVEASEVLTDAIRQVAGANGEILSDQALRDVGDQVSLAGRLMFFSDAELLAWIGNDRDNLLDDATRMTAAKDLLDTWSRMLAAGARRMREKAEKIETEAN